MLNSWSNVFYLCQKFASQIYGEIWAENCAGLARNVPFCLAIAMYCQTAVKTVQNEYCMGKSFTSYSLLTPQVSEFYSKIVNNIFDSSDKWQLFDSDSCQSLLSAINNLPYCHTDSVYSTAALNSLTVVKLKYLIVFIKWFFVCFVFADFPILQSQWGSGLVC